MKSNLFLILSLLCSVCFMSCDDDDVSDDRDPSPPPKMITTMNFRFTAGTDGENVLFTYVDPDGQGGEDPVITGGTLKSNTSYIGYLELFNEAVSPAENITDELLLEAEEYQFFFQTNIDGLRVNYTDDDDNGNPIGIVNNPRTEAFDTGTLTVVLRHFPDKFGVDVSTGDITNAGGETDIEVTFPVSVRWF